MTLLQQSPCIEGCLKECVLLWLICMPKLCLLSPVDMGCLSTYYGPVCGLLLADQYNVIICYVREVLFVIQSPSISKYGIRYYFFNFTSVYYFHFIHVFCHAELYLLEEPCPFEINIVIEMKTLADRSKVDEGSHQSKEC